MKPRGKMQRGFLAVGVTALFAFAALAKGLKDPSANPEPAYNTATVVDFWAIVNVVREVKPGLPMEGVHLEAKTGANTFDVYLGPTDFVKMFKLTFDKGAKIHVIGSKVRFGDTDLVLARELTRGKITIVLRDMDGRPIVNGRPVLIDWPIFETSIGF